MRSVTYLMLLTTFLGYAGENGSTPAPHVVQAGEELRYKVRWNFFRLGTIILRTSQDSSCHSPSDFKVSMTVESNPDLPFLWIREYNESLFDGLQLTSKGFRARHRNGDDCYAVDQTHYSGQRKTVCTRTDLNSGTILRVDTIHNVDKYVEGPSLFFYARCMSRSICRVNVPTLVEAKMSSTDICVDGSIQEVTIEAMVLPVRTRIVKGFTYWTGGSSAGMSGEFAGWMSDDEAAIPIRAEMKILLGSITLELEQWKRPGWKPPFTQNASTN